MNEAEAGTAEWSGGWDVEDNQGTQRQNQSSSDTDYHFGAMCLDVWHASASPGGHINPKIPRLHPQSIRLHGIFTSNKFPGDAAAGGTGTILSRALFLPPVC
jgi:hypothetical protein